MITRKQFIFPAFGCTSILFLLLVSAQPIKGEQIVAVVDEHGHKVYVNVPEMTAATRASIVQSFRPIRTTLNLPPQEVARLVSEASKRQQVDAKLVHSIIQVESGYDPNAVSRKGAMGLMQLIPDTAKRFGVANPFDPKQNIDGGVSYLKYLLKLFVGDLRLSLAAYNAGENSVLRSGGVPAFQETVDYVRRVSNLYSAASPSTPVEPAPKEAPQAPIYRYVDARGVVHYTNGYEF